MKKLIIFILTLMIFTSCEVITSDPILKESERIGVLEKAKTDTLNIYIEMDKKVYVVRENNIVKSGDNDQSHIIFPIILTIVLSFALGILVGSR